MATQIQAARGPVEFGPAKAALPSTADKIRGRIGALTSMRFLAALVIFFHHVEGFFGTPDSSVPLRKIAVSFFFVLSGFLLTLIYSQRDRGFSTWKFYRRRLQRIYPLHWVGMIVTVALATNYYMRGFERDWAEWLGIFIRTTFLVQTWNPLDPFNKWVNGVTWSLSVLIYFYLVFPLVFQTRKYWASWMLGVTVASILGVWLLTRLATLGLIDDEQCWHIVHYFPPLRAIEFVVGMVAACIYVNMRPQNWLFRLASRPKTATFFDFALIMVVLVTWQWGSNTLAPRITQMVRTKLASVEEPARSTDHRLSSVEPMRRLGEGVPGIAQRSSYTLAVVSSPVAEVSDGVNDNQPPSLQRPQSNQSQPNRERPAGQSVQQTNEYNNFKAFRLFSRWYGYVGFSLPASLLIIWFASSRGLLAWLLGRPLLVSLGDLSFAFFLIHRPIILFTNRSLKDLTNDSPIPGVFISLVLSLFVSWLLFQLVENPASKRRKEGDSTKGWFASYFHAVRQGLSRPGHKAIGTFCLGGVLIIPLVSWTTSGIGAPKPEPGLRATYESGLELNFDLEETNRALRIEITRMDSHDLSGKVLIHIVNSRGKVIKRFRVADLATSPNTGGTTPWNVKTVRFGQYEDIKSVRCSFVPRVGVLEPVKSGPTDRRNRGVLLWELDPRRPSKRP